MSDLQTREQMLVAITKEARAKAIEDCEMHVRQALMDAAHVHRETRDIASGIFKAEIFATAAIRALQSEER